MTDKGHLPSPVPGSGRSAAGAQEAGIAQPPLASLSPGGEKAR